MSKDIYDQFKAEREKLAREAESRRREELRIQREAEDARIAAAEEARRKVEALKRGKEQKIAASRELMRPVNTKLLQILETIKRHDPGINNARISDIVTDEEVRGHGEREVIRRLVRGYPIEYEYDEYFGSYDVITYMQLRWGNKFDLTGREKRMIESPWGQGLIATLTGNKTPDKILYEDFELISLSTDAEAVKVVGESFSKHISIADFTQDSSIVIPHLAKALSDPIKRNNYSARYYAMGNSWFKLCDSNGNKHDYTSVTSYGKRVFSDRDYDPADGY